MNDNCMKNVVCKQCGEMGHLSIRCPLNKANTSTAAILAEEPEPTPSRSIVRNLEESLAMIIDESVSPKHHENLGNEYFENDVKQEVLDREDVKPYTSKLLVKKDQGNGIHCVTVKIESIGTNDEKNCQNPTQPQPIKLV